MIARPSSDRRADAPPAWITPYGDLDPFDVLLLAIVRRALLDLACGVHGRIHDRSHPGPAAYRWFHSADCAWIIGVLAPDIDTAAFCRGVLARYWPEPAPPPILMSRKGG